MASGDGNSVSAAWAQVVAGELRKAGVDLESALREAGLEARTINNEDTWIPTHGTPPSWRSPPASSRTIAMARNSAPASIRARRMRFPTWEPPAARLRTDCAI